jgi:hypothetical protein
MSMHMIRGVQIHGKSKKKKTKSVAVKIAEEALSETLKRVGYKGTKIVDKPYKHELNVKHGYTSDVIPGNGNKKEVKVYTGTEIGGIAVMHKSNLIPIRKDNKEAFIDVAQMRRT